MMVIKDKFRRYLRDDKLGKKDKDFFAYLMEKKDFNLNIHDIFMDYLGTKIGNKKNYLKKIGELSTSILYSMMCLERHGYIETNIKLVDDANND